MPDLKLTIPPLSVQKAARKVLAWMAEEGLFNMDIMGIGDEEGQVLLVERVVLRGLREHGERRTGNSVLPGDIDDV